MEKVSFYSEGNKLAGYIRIPKAGHKVPGIVVCHGYSGWIEGYMHDIAEAISDGGYATLIFSSRGLGESEGIKGRMIPMEQVADIRNAITYLQTRKEIDPDKLGLYGTSFGGANVSYVAGVDSRAKCTVSAAGIGDGGRWLKSIRRRWEWLEFVKRVEEDRVKRVITGKSQYVDPHEILLPDPGTSESMKILWPKEGKAIGYPLETADAIIDYKPELVVDRIAPRAIMWIHMGNDVTVDPEESRSMYQRAKEPRKLVIMEGRAHYDAYKFKNPDGFKEVMGLALDWYRQYLPIE